MRLKAPSLNVMFCIFIQVLYFKDIMKRFCIMIILALVDGKSSSGFLLGIFEILSFYFRKIHCPADEGR